MKLNLKKLASLLTSSLLVAGGLVGLAATPAKAVATTFDFESNTAGANGWGNVFGFAENGNGWGNTVTDQPVGSPVAGAKAIKATEGSGAYSGTNVGSIATNASLVSSTKIASVVFYSPLAGETLRLKVEEANDSTYSHFITADAVTVAGWQTLVFDFTNPSTGTFNSNYNYSMASVNFRPASTTLQPGNEAYYVDEVQFGLPQVVFDFESNTVGANGWGNVFGFAENGNGWGNTVNDQMVGSPVAGTKAIKATEGSGAYSGTNVGSIATNATLISATQKRASVVFYSPLAGETLRLKVEEANDSTYSHFITADAVTVAGWQTLVFDFTNPSTGTFNANYSYSMASVNFRPASTTLQPGNEAYYVDEVKFNNIPGAAAQQQVVVQTVDYDVRLISSQKNTSTDTDTWADCNGASWCQNNSYYLKMIAAGSTTTLNYVVTQHGTTTPVNGATVRLKMNTGYSGSNATWSTSQTPNSGTTFAAVSTSNSADAGYIEATSNSQGQVSFTFTNTNTNGEAARTLNVANPYPAGCLSPAGQTKAALQPFVQSVTGATVGAQYVDVLWPHISSSTINTSIALGADGSNCVVVAAGTANTRGLDAYGAPAVADKDNVGPYPHIRLEKQFLDTYFDASWWDGVWQYRDADTKAYLKYIPVRSTFKLTYYVTDAKNVPLVGADVSLIVNANYACAKTFFMHENSLIGPDDCAGGGQTELPAKKTDKFGRVSFVLTNTNEVGEATPGDLNGLPNGKELGTNIKPHLVGATTEGIDMLFAHFVEPSGAAKVAAPEDATVKAGQTQESTFTFTDESGAPIRSAAVSYYINGFNSKVGTAKTNSKGQVTIQSNNFSKAAGTQAVAVSLIRNGKLPLTATANINWTSAAVAMGVSAGKQALAVKVTNALGQIVKVSIAGKIFTKRATSDSATFKFAVPAGKKKVSVSVGNMSSTKMVTVTN